MRPARGFSKRSDWKNGSGERKRRRKTKRGGPTGLTADHDVGARGPVYRKWYESCFMQKHGAAKLARHHDEATALITALDEFHSGRMLEVGDVLASRLRMLTFGTETGKWGVAREFLAYAPNEHSLVSDATVAQAIRLNKRSSKLASDLAKSSNHGADR